MSRSMIRLFLPPLLFMVSLVLVGGIEPSRAQAPVVPGFPNVQRTEGELLAGLIAPQQGRTAILAYHNGILFSVPEQPSSEPGSDYQVRSWSLADPTQPVELATHGITQHPINAHGYFKSGDYLVLGSNWPPEAPWSFRADGPGTLVRTEFPDLLCAGGRGCLFQPWYVHSTWWSYNEVEDNALLELNGVRLAEWDHLAETGVIGHPFLIGDLLIYASDQSRTGVATYDISDPTSPVLLDVLTEGGPGGYWPEVWGGDGRLYIVFPYRIGGNGIRVVDATDPADLRLIADVPLPGDQAMYAQFQDEYAFVGSHKVDMRTLRSVLDFDGANTVRTSDGQVGIDTSQFLLPLGNLLVTGGIGPNQGMAIWAHQAAPDTRGPSVGYHRPLAGQTGVSTQTPISLLIHETLETPTIVNGVTFIARPLGGQAIPGRLTFAFDDILTFTPDQPLLPNTTYEVVLPTDGIRDAAGNGMEGYSFTFSTGTVLGGNRPPSADEILVSAYPVLPGATATLSAVVSDPDGDPLEVRFDRGDGSPKTPWTPAPDGTASLSVNWTDEGHYRVSVQVRDPSGSIASRTRTVTVRTPPAGPLAASSSPIVCEQTSRRVWRVQPEQDTVVALGTDTLTVELEVAVCDEPRGLVRTADGEIWVACRGDDRIAILDAGGTVTSTLELGYGSGPVALVADPTGTEIVVALESRGEIRRYQATTRAETGRLALGPWPRALAMSADGTRLLVSRFLSPVSHGEVWEVDPTTMSLLRTLRLPKLGGPANVDSTAGGRGVPNLLRGIAISPDGQSAFIVATKANVDRGLLFGDDLSQDNTVRNLLVELDLTSGTVARTIDLDNSDSASAVAFSPLGDYLFVALQGNDAVVVLDALDRDASAGLGSLVTRLGTGGAPQGVCLDAPTGQTFVADFTGRSITVLDTDRLLRAGDIAVPEVQISTVSAETFPPEALRGQTIFYAAGDRRMSAEGYLSCATCHPDGGHDGRTWDFTGRGEGLRNTTDLRGREGTGHGNVHWSANFDEIQDFEADIRLAFGGTGFLSDADWEVTQDPLGPVKAGLDPDLDALAAYVTTLGARSIPRSPFRQLDGTPTPAAITGAGIFTREGCASCHAGDAMTDSTLGEALLHDVGTLRTTSGDRLGGSLDGIDTPTLRGTWATAPYLHDGSAPSLDEVFRATGGVVVPAESGTPFGSAFVVDQWVEINQDDTVRGRAFVAIDGPGGGLVLSGIDGGPGGPGSLEIRYSVGWQRPLEVSVGGAVVETVQLLPPGNDPPWHHTVWGTIRVDGIGWQAGAVNTVELRYPEDDSFPNISLDEVTVSTATERAAADVHRRVLDLSAAERDALVAFVLELDTPPPALPTTIFADGFESGDTGAWSSP